MSSEKLQLPRLSVCRCIASSAGPPITSQSQRYTSQRQNTWEKLQTLSYGCSVCETIKQQPKDCESPAHAHLRELRGLPVPSQVKNYNYPGFQSAAASRPPLLHRSPANHSATRVRGDEHERRFTGASAICRRAGRKSIAGQTRCSAASRGATRYRRP